jgi:hypothetical protein
MIRHFNMGLRNLILDGAISYTASTISFDSGTKEIRDSSGLLPCLNPGDLILVDGSSLNDGVKTLDVVTIDQTKYSVVETVSSESAGSPITVSIINGRTFRQLFRNCILELYGGTMPTDPQTSESGFTKLLRVTISKGAVVPGIATNGLNFEAISVDGILSKAAGETWQGEGLDDGDATWCRCYANHYPTGTDHDAVRFDGDVGAIDSGSMIELASVTIQTGVTTTLDTFDVDLGA